MDPKPKFPAQVVKFPDVGDSWEHSYESEADVPHIIMEVVLDDLGIKLDAHSKVLEIGSGKAASVDYLRKKGINAFGVDVNTFAARKVPQVKARIEQLPLKDESFKVVMAFNVFDDHVYNQDHALMLQEVSRVLEHGGIFIAVGWEIKSPTPFGMVFVKEVSEGSRSVYKKE